MDSNPYQGKYQKYFFTENIFDDDHIEEPPPPSFSEQELEAAKKKSFTEGRTQGLKEAEASLLKQSNQILEKIQKQLVELSAAEGLREKVFEQETLKLCLAVFEKLFPLYYAHTGFEELRAAITEIVKKQEGQSHIAITIAPDITEAIEAQLNSLRDAGYELKFSVKGDDSLSPGACRLAWSDGGAILNPEMIADEIRTSIQQVLAKKGSKGHDSGGTGSDGDAS